MIFFKAAFMIGINTMTRKKILSQPLSKPLYLLAFAFCSLMATGQPKSLVAEKIIAVVGDKIILKSDIDNSLLDMKRQGIELPPDAYCLTLDQAMAVKALVLQAEKDSLPVSDEEVDADIDNRIRYYINQFGSKEEVEKVAGKTLYQLKEDFKINIRDQRLATAMRNKIVDGIKITPNEVRDYFNTIPVDSLPYYETEVEVGQIIIFPKASRDAEEYCIEQLRDYKRQIESGKKDFASMASLFTEDPGSKERGGQYEINRNQKDLDPIWLSKAFSLKPGQISNPFRSRFGYHIIQLVSRLGDDAIVRHILKVPQVTQIELRTGFERMDTVRAKLIAGTIDFGMAVSKYSDDESSKYSAGRIQPREGNYLTIDQLDKDLVVRLKELAVGSYSKPYEYMDERGRKGIRMIYLISRTEPHRENLRQDYNRIAQRALEQKKENTLERWFDGRIQNYYIMLDPDFGDCPSLKKWYDAAKAVKK
jgi:peptidyl-prolyl cis-trans isomerase SurA